MAAEKQKASRQACPREGGGAPTDRRRPQTPPRHCADACAPCNTRASMYADALHPICAQGMSKHGHTTHHERQTSSGIRKCRANFQVRMGMSRACMAIAAMVFRHPGKL